MDCRSVSCVWHAPWGTGVPPAGDTKAADSVRAGRRLPKQHHRGEGPCENLERRPKHRHQGALTTRPRARARRSASLFVGWFSLFSLRAHPITGGLSRQAVASLSAHKLAPVYNTRSDDVAATPGPAGATIGALTTCPSPVAPSGQGRTRR